MNLLFVGIAFIVGLLIGLPINTRPDTEEEIKEKERIKKEFSNKYKIGDLYNIKEEIGFSDNLVAAKIQKLKYPYLIMSYKLNTHHKECVIKTVEITEKHYTCLLNKINIRLGKK